MSNNGRSAKNIQMTTYDDLFFVGELDDTFERIQEIELARLKPFRNHPFKVLDDETMQKLVDSIREYGVLIPGIARPASDGSYELIAGHRRKHASELVGMKTMPVLVREMDDDESTIVMVDSNLQRENLLPSEKAWAYRMKLEAIRRKAGRPSKNNSGQVGQNLKGKSSVEIIAGDVGESCKQVQRYIRLTELLPVLLQMVDEKKISFNPAVEISYLVKEEQEQLVHVMKELSVTPSLEQSKRLKKYSQEGKLGRDVMDAILTEDRSVSLQLTIKKDKIKKYFPDGYTQKQMEDVIYTLLESWVAQQR